MRWHYEQCLLAEIEYEIGYLNLSGPFKLSTPVTQYSLYLSCLRFQGVQFSLRDELCVLPRFTERAFLCDAEPVRNYLTIQPEKKR